MKNKIRIQLDSGQHNEKRGVGFYASFLTQGLSKTDDITLTNTNPDIIHYTYFDLFQPSLPFNHTVPFIVTIHDLTPLVLKRQYPLGFRSLATLIRQRIALSRASAIITDSECSKKDIHQMFRISPHKIFAIPLATDPIFTQKPLSRDLLRVKKMCHLPDKFILFVGGANPNKNLSPFVKSVVKLNQNVVLVGSDFQKAIVQDRGSYKAKLGLQPVAPELKDLSFVRSFQNKHPNQIITPGFVELSDLNCLYRLALAYCQPSLYEGFGIPLLEAMTAGCLIISANTASLPEIYPKNTITFDPKSETSLENAITKAINLPPEKKRRLINSAKSRSKDFNWEKTTTQTIEIYKFVTKL